MNRILSHLFLLQATAAMAAWDEQGALAARECVLVRQSIKAIRASEDFPGKDERLGRYQEQEKILCGEDRRAASRLAYERMKKKCEAMSKVPQIELPKECNNL